MSWNLNKGSMPYVIITIRLLRGPLTPGKAFSYHCSYVSEIFAMRVKNNSETHLFMTFCDLTHIKHVIFRKR